MAKDQSIKSILVYVGSNPDDAIGENILKLPFLRAIRQTYPEARITWVAGHGPCFFEGLLKPLVDEMIEECITDLYIDDNPRELFFRWRPLAGRRFDLIIDAQRNPIRSLVLRRVHHKIFISGCWRYVFSDKKPTDEFIHPSLLTDKLLGLVAAAAGQTVRPSHIWPLNPEWHHAAARLLPDGASYVGFAPGAGKKGTGKCWPLDRFVELAQGQQEKGRVPVFFIGPGESTWLSDLRRRVPSAQFPEWDRDAIAAALKGPALAMALAGRLSAAVSNCSGIGHILAAGGAPMVSLFGPTRPSKYAPYTPDRIIIRAKDFDAAGRIDAIPLPVVSSAVDQHVADRQRSDTQEPIASIP